MQSVYMKSLVEVVARGSFSQAAEALCVTQSAVSRRIRLLEEQYGCELIDRSKSPVQATPEGLVVIEKARAILSLETDLLKGLADIRAKHSFSFCCTPSFAMASLPGILANYLKTTANAIEIKFGVNLPARVVEGIRDGSYDLAVIEHCDDLDLGGLTHMPLGSDELAFVSSKHSELPPGSVELKQLLQQALLVRSDGCCARALLESSLARLGRSINDFRKFVVLDDMNVVVETVRAGGAIAFLSHSVVRVVRDDLKFHYVDDFQHTRSRSLVLGERAKACPMLREFRDAIINAINECSDALAEAGRLSMKPDELGRRSEAEC